MAKQSLFSYSPIFTEISLHIVHISLSALFKSKSSGVKSWLKLHNICLKAHVGSFLG